MTRRFVFVRAINTGNRRLTNDELLAPLQASGAHEVAAYQAAGNLTFRSDDPALTTAEALETLLSESYGFEAPVFVRSGAELDQVLAVTPFSDDQIAATAGKVQVTFMHHEPPGDKVTEAQALVPDDDAVVFEGREWFWLPQEGISGSALPVGAIERLVGPMTMRTRGTLIRMRAKFAG